MTANDAPIGFIGLGQMGLPMAKNLLASGKRVVAWSRSSEERAAFQGSGGEVVESLAEIGECSTVFSIVFDDDAVQDIALAPGALAATLAPGSIHIAMETISPKLARAVTDAYAARGVLHLSAPVFGPPHVAAAAGLKFNCSGPAAAYQSVEPLLAAMGSSYWFGPEPEQALMVKLMGNNMIFTIIELLHEAFGFLGAGGIKETDIREMLVERLFQSPIITGYAQFFVDNPGAKPPFDANPIPRKDNRLCLEMAESMGMDLSLVSLVRTRMEAVD